ncbi:STAS domain-containing protein [Lentzea sp. NPDC004789]
MTELKPRAPISVQTIQIDLVPVTSVAGEIDMSNDDLVRREVHTQLGARPGVLVLDLSEVEFIGSAGINLLVQSQREAVRHGTRLAVVAPGGGCVNRVLSIAGVSEVLDLHHDLPSAVAAG